MKLVVSWLGALALSFFIISCGGGADVGNPVLYGTVTNPDGTPASGATVIVNTGGADPSSDTMYICSPTGCTVTYISGGKFDTTHTNAQGNFTFASCPSGNFTLVAEKGNTIVMKSVEQSAGGTDSVGMQLQAGARLTVLSPNNAADSSQGVASARIAGTGFTAVPDNAGTVTFSLVPPGDMNVVLYQNDKNAMLSPEITITPACSASMIIDPTRPVDTWIIEGCGPRDPLSRPYIIWSSPQNHASGAAARVNYSSPYSLSIQFSLPMDTRHTSAALKVLVGGGGCRFPLVAGLGHDVCQVVVRICRLFRRTFFVPAGRDLFSSGRYNRAKRAGREFFLPGNAFM